VLPDRLIVYLWPHAGGTKFSFNFKPRFGLKALTAPSILYDYYNPKPHAIVEPNAIHSAIVHGGSQISNYKRWDRRWRGLFGVGL